MIENAAAQGARFLDGLKKHPRQHRPRGARPRPDAGGRAAPRSRPRAPLLRGAAGAGLLAKETHEHTIRIAPPLVITADQVDWALEQIDATLMQDLS